MSFVLLKKWSQLSDNYGQFPGGMELIGVYGDDGGIPNGNGFEKANLILKKEGVLGKAGNPNSTSDLDVELEWDLGDFVLAFDDLLEEFEGYPEQLQLDILKEKYECVDRESEQVLALLSGAGFQYVEDVEKTGNDTFILVGDAEYTVLSAEESEAVIVNGDTYYIFRMN